MGDTFEAWNFERKKIWNSKKRIVQIFPTVQKDTSIRRLNIKSSEMKLGLIRYGKMKVMESFIRVYTIHIPKNAEYLNILYIMKEIR